MRHEATKNDEWESDEQEPKAREYSRTERDDPCCET